VLLLQQAAKPIPPWLMSSHKAAAGAGGMSSAQQQQPGSSMGFSSGMGVKQDSSSSMLVKSDPAGVKLEGVKAEPGFKTDPGLKQVSSGGISWLQFVGLGPRGRRRVGWVVAKGQPYECRQQLLVGF
jgi:hypothetical protein